ncbi:hypothetical protein GWK41_04550 [Persephonella atlantica]|uniref:PelD GGDEF domain-containing protein n=1 Tax=Persephonella atlantica TaxID=2699429 RepID=A0ABS1GHH9_9AQUI|nr:PelD GGDEF domain-containing protein [Persephonella atlantica]MBK3332336.1 hypothetical protein [Persephonella atlantica]
MSKNFYRILVESFLLSLGFILLGYVWNSEDPLFLFIEGKITPYVFVIAILTLYYGLISGFVSILVFGVSIYFMYEKFPYDTFFWYTLLMFVFSEFHYMWKRKLDRTEEENRYLKNKIENLGRNYFMLKISHDQIERNYVLKPLSIRSVLKEIRKMILEKDRDLYKNFLMLIARFTNIDSCSLYVKKDGNFVEVSKVGKGAKWNKKDPLLQKALEDKTSVYLSVAAQEKEYSSEYLAVLPVTDIYGDVKGVLLINDIPFLSLNKDNLLSISVFLTYLFDEISIEKEVGQFIERYPEIDSYFIKELEKLIELNRKFSIESSIIVFSQQKTRYIEAVFVQIEKSLRGLDLSTRCSYGEKEKLVVLLPFTNEVSSIDFIERINQRLKDTFGEDIGIESRMLTVEESIEIVLEKIRNI